MTLFVRPKSGTLYAKRSLSSLTKYPATSSMKFLILHRVIQTRVFTWIWSSCGIIVNDAERAQYVTTGKIVARVLALPRSLEYHRIYAAKAELCISKLSKSAAFVLSFLVFPTTSYHHTFDFKSINSKVFAGPSKSACSLMIYCRPGVDDDAAARR